jgi:2-succinyl-5-enolpyruvyl-6-hydroxy-3-cyclohexene-1-carboxylate synthase
MTGSMELARTVVDELVRNGVSDAVLSPGSRSGPVAVALAEADDAGRLRLHVRIDERGAGYLAIGLIRGTGRPVPVVCTSGTAVANLHPAVLEAYHAGLPLLAITPDRPVELHGVGANQTTAHERVLGGSVRWSGRLGSRGDLATQGPYWRATVSRAVRTALGEPVGPPGPVHLNLELSEPLVPTGAEQPTPPGRAGGRAWARSDGAVHTPGPALRLDSATPTLVLAGDGAGPVAGEVAVRAGWPMLAEPSSGGWGTPASLPCAPYVAASRRFLLRHRVARLVVFGRPTLSRSVLRLLTEDLPEVVVVAGRHAEWPDPGHRASHVVAAVAPRGEPRPGWQATWRAAGARAWLAAHEVLEDQAWPAEPAVAPAVVAALPPGASCVLGSSQPIRDVYVLAAPRADLHLTANRGLSGIDGTVSTAVGHALARRGPSYALLGDLAFWHDATGLLVGPGEPRPDLCLVVVNNDGGGIFSMLEPGEPRYARFFERVFATPTGGDVGAWCAGAGVQHEAVRTRDELVAALAPRPGLRVVEVRTDRGLNRDVHQAVRTAAVAAVEGE